MAYNVDSMSLGCSTTLPLQIRLHDACGRAWLAGCDGVARGRQRLIQQRHLVGERKRNSDYPDIGADIIAQF